MITLILSLGLNYDSKMASEGAAVVGCIACHPADWASVQQLTILDSGDIPSPSIILLLINMYNSQCTLFVDLIRVEQGVGRGKHTQ